MDADSIPHNVTTPRDLTSTVPINRTRDGVSVKSHRCGDQGVSNSR